MPISVITIEALSSIGKIWLGIATRPIVAITAEMRQQHRDAGGDQRAERDHQDDQGDRERQRLGLREVALHELVVELLADGGVAELLDAQRRGGPAGRRWTAASTGAIRIDGGGGVALDVEAASSAECRSFETRPGRRRDR